jgi:hypothetical protein
MKGLTLITLFIVIATACACPMVLHLLRKVTRLSPHSFGSHSTLLGFSGYARHYNLLTFKFLYPAVPCPALCRQIVWHELGTVLDPSTLAAVCVHDLYFRSPEYCIPLHDIL